MLGDDIAFNGDGMITRFHIHDGQCDFRQRWARTDKWNAEDEAGRGLFGTYRNPLTDDPSTKGMIRSTANTNAWLSGGKLWALKEDSPALVMDPVTMETSGFEKFGGKMTGQTFTAHPKIDPTPATWSRSAMPQAGCAPTTSPITRSAPRASWSARSGSRFPITA